MPENLWRGKNVLITGIAGFIGVNLARALLMEGARVTGIVRSINGNFNDILRNCNIVVGDVCDYKFLRETISSNEIDMIYHFAAYSIVRVSAGDPLSAYAINVMGTVNLLEAARNVGRNVPIVVASSDKAYGDHDDLPYLETHALQPKNTYDTSKACMDMIARSYAHNYAMPVAVSRCSNVYGPGDPNLSRIVPNTVRRVIEGKPPVLYSDIEVMEREFIYIDDVVSAYLAVGSQLAKSLVPTIGKNFVGEAFNIGGTGPVRVRDLTTMICNEVGRPELEPQIVHREPTFKEIRRQYIDASKLTSLTGWKPQVALKDGIRQTVNWYAKMFAPVVG